MLTFQTEEDVVPNDIHPLIIESQVRTAFNAAHGTNATKQRVLMRGGLALHEFDMHDPSRLIGGISTSPWRNVKSRTSNTGGQDRASTKLFWLSLWDGPERRVHLLTDREMAEKEAPAFEPFPPSGRSPAAVPPVGITCTTGGWA
jgi:hypothetical protein